MDHRIIKSDGMSNTFLSIQKTPELPVRIEHHHNQYPKTKDHHDLHSVCNQQCMLDDNSRKHQYLNIRNNNHTNRVNNVQRYRNYFDIDLDSDDDYLWDNRKIIPTQNKQNTPKYNFKYKYNPYQSQPILHHPSAIIHHPSNTIHHPSNTIHHPLTTIHHPSTTIHHPPTQPIHYEQPVQIINHPINHVYPITSSCSINQDYCIDHEKQNKIKVSANNSRLHQTRSAQKLRNSQGLQQALNEQNDRPDLLLQRDQLINQLDQQIKKYNKLVMQHSRLKNSCRKQNDKEYNQMLDRIYGQAKQLYDQCSASPQFQKQFATKFNYVRLFQSDIDIEQLTKFIDFVVRYVQNNEQHRINYQKEQQYNQIQSYDDDNDNPSNQPQYNLSPNYNCIPNYNYVPYIPYVPNYNYITNQNRNYQYVPQQDYVYRVENCNPNQCYYNNWYCNEVEQEQRNYEERNEDRKMKDGRSNSNYGTQKQPRENKNKPRDVEEQILDYLSPQPNNIDDFNPSTSDFKKKSNPKTNNQQQQTPNDVQTIQSIDSMQNNTDKKSKKTDGIKTNPKTNDNDNSTNRKGSRKPKDSANNSGTDDKLRTSRKYDSTVSRNYKHYLMNSMNQQQIPSYYLKQSNMNEELCKQHQRNVDNDHYDKVYQQYDKLSKPKKMNKLVADKIGKVYRNHKQMQTDHNS